MLRIHCPWCGERDEVEFRSGGESHITRPSFQADDATWARYLFCRSNPKGVQFERWCHEFGCEQWFNVARDTLTHEIRSIYILGTPKPALSSAIADQADNLIGSR
jgi:sarcosine oxidase subunit delta